MSGAKIHIGFDEWTLDILAAENTSSAVDEAMIPAGVPSQIAHQEEIACVTADVACDTRRHRRQNCGGSLPPRKHACLWRPEPDGAKVRKGFEPPCVLGERIGANGADITPTAAWKRR